MSIFTRVRAQRDCRRHTKKIEVIKAFRLYWKVLKKNNILPYQSCYQVVVFLQRHFGNSNKPKKVKFEIIKMLLLMNYNEV